jgi:hypothetical protein
MNVVDFPSGPRLGFFGPPDRVGPTRTIEVTPGRFARAILFVMEAAPIQKRVAVARAFSNANPNAAERLSIVFLGEVGFSGIELGG